MQVSSCLSPKRIYNKYSHEYITVPCGHCAACHNIKAVQWSDRLAKELSLARSAVFVTLTFSDAHVPLYFFPSEFHPTDTDKFGHRRAVQVTSDDLVGSHVNYMCSIHGGVPVLSHSFVSQFIKHFKLIYNEQIQYFVCGEYGGRTFRPHFHLVFISNGRIDGAFFEGCVRDSWTTDLLRRVYPTSKALADRYPAGYESEPLGFVSIQYVNKQSRATANYVASYLNSVSDLPRLLQRAEFRQFHTQSRTAIGLSFFPPKALREAFYTASPEVRFSSLADNSELLLRVPRYAERKLFPPVDGFGLQLRRLCPSLRLAAMSFSTVFREYGVVVEDRCPLSLLISSLVHDTMSEDYELRFKTLLRWSRRCIALAHEYHVSLAHYCDLYFRYYDNCKLWQLRQFYQLQADLVEQGLTPSYLLSLYVPQDKDNFSHYQLSLFGLDETNFRKFLDFGKIPSFARYRLRSLSLAKNRTKTKERNTETSTRGNY